MENWKDFCELRRVNTNYSGMSYSYETAKAMGIVDRKHSESTLGKVHTVSVRDEIELFYNQESGMKYRIHKEKNASKCKTRFDTNFGAFINDNDGEFGGCVYTSSGMPVYGNFEEIVDHKNKVYAVDSLNHMGIGHFRLLQFTNANEYRIIYQTKHYFNESENLDFGALYDTGEMLYLIISGWISKGRKKDRKFTKCTKILTVQDSQVTELFVLEDSFCGIMNLIVVENMAYVSMDKIVARINLQRGVVEYFTHLSETAENDLIETEKRWKREERL